MTTKLYLIALAPAGVTGVTSAVYAIHDMHAAFRFATTAILFALVASLDVVLDAFAKHLGV